MSDVPKILYTTEEAAYALSVCRQTILKYIEQGYLPAKRSGRTIRIHRKDLEALAKNGLPSVWENKPWPVERERRSA
jgi:excisionase family DNA binding protein